MTDNKKNDVLFLDTKQVAARLQCSLPMARQIMRRADFPLIRVGRSFKVLESAFAEWSSRRRI